MDTAEKLKEIERAQQMLTQYRNALETVSRLENDPQLRVFLSAPNGSSTKKKEQAKPKTARFAELVEKSLEEKSGEEPADKERDYYGETDQETLLKIGYQTIGNETIQGTDLLALAEAVAPVFTAQKELDEKKVNDHLSRAFNAGEAIGGLRVQRVVEGKRGRGGYPASYRILAEGEAEPFD